MVGEYFENCAEYEFNKETKPETQSSLLEKYASCLEQQLGADLIIERDDGMALAFFI
jgi:hypothetical protein